MDGAGAPKQGPVIIAYQKWSRRTITYQTFAHIGEGAFGSVFLATDPHGNRVALKKVRLENEREGFPLTALREIKILRSLRHKNLVSLLDVVTGRSAGFSAVAAAASSSSSGSSSGAAADIPVDPLAGVYMVFEYLDHDLYGLRSVQLGAAQIKYYLKQVLEGLYFLHKCKIIHRDIKGSNILISNEHEVKLADFGLARSLIDRRDFGAGASSFARPPRQQVDGGYTNRVVTLWYRAPELLLGATQYGPEIDMWSVGCLFAEMILGDPLFSAASGELSQLETIFQICGTPNMESWPSVSKMPWWDKLRPRNEQPRRLRDRFTNLPPAAYDLLDQLLCLDPLKRLTADQALRHDYFWKEEPAPADPQVMPGYAESFHENDVRVRKQRDAFLAAAGGSAQALPQELVSVLPGAAVGAAARKHRKHRHGGGGEADPLMMNGADFASAGNGLPEDPTLAALGRLDVIAPPPIPTGRPLINPLAVSAPPPLRVMPLPPMPTAPPAAAAAAAAALPSSSADPFPPPLGHLGGMPPEHHHPAFQPHPPPTHQHQQHHRFAGPPPPQPERGYGHPHAFDHPPHHDRVHVAASLPSSSSHPHPFASDQYIRGPPDSPLGKRKQPSTPQLMDPLPPHKHATHQPHPPPPSLHHQHSRSFEPLPPPSQGGYDDPLLDRRPRSRSPPRFASNDFRELDRRDLLERRELEQRRDWLERRELDRAHFAARDEFHHNHHLDHRPPPPPSSSGHAYDPHFRRERSLSPHRYHASSSLGPPHHHAPPPPPHHSHPHPHHLPPPSHHPPPPAANPFHVMQQFAAQLIAHQPHAAAPPPHGHHSYHHPGPAYRDRFR